MAANGVKSRKEGYDEGIAIFAERYTEAETSFPITIDTLEIL